MKKCGTLIFSLLLAALCSCNPQSNAKSTQTDAKPEPVAEQPKETPVTLCDTIPLDSYSPDSPTLDYSIMLEPLKLNNDAATEKAVMSISYVICGRECSSLTQASESYINRLTGSYQELRPDYIDIKANNGQPHWLNHSYSLKGTAGNGYKGSANYLLEFYEYTGGAHPYSYNLAFSFDPNDGHEITLDGIMKENYEEALLAIITRELMSHFNVNSIEELDNYLFNYKELFISKNFMLGADSLIILYNKYEIAPYAIGDIILNIEYDKLKEIMK